jgi:hypothetical protein
MRCSRTDAGANFGQGEFTVNDPGSKMSEKKMQSIVSIALALLRV